MTLLRQGVRIRLLGAFLLISGLSLVTAGYALYGLHQVRQSLNDVARVAGPVALQSADLGDRITALVALATQIPYMGYAPEQQSEARALLEKSSGQAQKIVEELKGRPHVDSTRLANIEARVGALMESYSGLDKMVSGWRDLRPRRNRLYEEAHDLRGEAEAVIGAAESSGSPTPTPTTAAGRPAADPLAQAQKRIASAYSLLIEFEWARDPAQLQAVAKRFDGYLDGLDDDVRALDPPSRDRLHAIALRLRELASGPAVSIESLRTQELENFAKFSAYLAEGFKGFTALRSELQQVEAEATAEAREAYSRAHGVEQHTQIVLGTLVTASLLFSFLFVWLYVDRQLLARLSQITTGMLSLAEGNTGIRVADTRRADEIGRMARSLEVFRAKLIERIRWENELNELAQSLEMKVEQRTAALRETAERLQEANRQIMDSIHYARRIQLSMLPSPAVANSIFADHGIHWEPRDNIGGDYYWLQKTNRGYLVVVADCTGHGVPGALLSVIVATQLRGILAHSAGAEPGTILEELDHAVRDALHGNGEATDFDDGLDVAIVHVDLVDKLLRYAGTGIPLTYVKDGAVREIAADGRGLGYRSLRDEFRYATHTVDLSPDLRCWLATDGLFGQIGGSARPRRGFGRRRFSELLLATRQAGTVKCQFDAVMHAFAEFQGNEARRDDLTVVAFAPG